MRVKVFPPLGKAVKNVDDRGWMELPDGSTLADVLKKGGIPRLMAKMLMVRLNSEAVPLSTEVRDGDVVGFISIIAAG